MKIGTYYYPEQWPREQWERDFDNIAKMGLKIVHMGEFAWYEMEPDQNQIRLGWLSECVEMAASRGMEVILCTPTASPPIWLSDRRPAMLPVDMHGTPTRFGGRRHYTPTSLDLHEAAWRIVSALAEKFGHHPAVIGWQIDNEYGSDGFDQSPQTHAAFRKWLAGKYGSIDGLNKAWGCAFWNTYYTDWDQIKMPPQRDCRYLNPHQCLDASRFWSWAFADFNRLQADALRAKIDVNRQFITTNFMPLHLDCDPNDMIDDLTLYSWDTYPVGVYSTPVENQEYRLGNPAQIGFVHDQMCSYRNRWALLEVQPGQVNWGRAGSHPFPGAVRLWLWTAFAHGAELLTVYRFRRPRFGVELFHDGLVEADGVTPSWGGKQFMQVIEEMSRLDLSQVPAAGEGYVPRETIGIVLDFDQLWEYAALPQQREWSQAEWNFAWYAAACRLGLKVRILHPHKPWPASLPIVIAPGLEMMDDDLKNRMQQYVDGGGNLVLTARTALMDRNGQLWEGPAAAPIVDLAGIRIESYDCLPEGNPGVVEMNGEKFAWRIWGDQVKPAAGTEPLATYLNQHYAGSVAATRRKIGSGSLTYCGVYAEQKFTDAILKALAESLGEARVAITEVPSRVQVVRRGPYRVALNYRTEAIEVPAAVGAKFVVGARNLEAGGVAVWTEN